MQPALMHESLSDAIIEVAQVVGGKKKLAEALWPTKKDGAHGHLLDCLNPDRPHKLSPDELVAIGRIGRDRQCDGVARFLCAEMGYQPPVPLNADQERDELRHRIADGLDYIKSSMTRLERLESAPASIRR